MADPEVQNSDEGTGTPPDSPQFPPGTLCAVETSYKDVVKLDEQEKAALKGLLTKFAKRDDPARREQILRIWRNRLFDRGKQHIFPLRGGGWTLFPTGLNWTQQDVEQKSTFVINVYTSRRQTITAALTRDTPNVRFEPVDSQDDTDITAADSANNLRKHIERLNKMLGLGAEQARLLWTDGVAIKLTRYVKDGPRFGYEPEPEGVVPEDENEANASGDGGNQENLAGNPSDGDISGNQESTEHGSPDGASEGNSEDGTESSESDVRSPSPRGDVVITVHGGLEFKLPMKANCRAECDYAQRCLEVSLGTAKAMFPDVADKIASGSGGPAGDDIDRLARVNVALGMDNNWMTTDTAAYDVTIQWNWLRLSSLLEVDDKDVRDRLMQKFKCGARVVYAGQTFCEARDISMDDQLSICFADAGDGVNRAGMGDWMVPVQKLVNNNKELENDYLIRGVPMTWMDSETFDVSATSEQTYTPGAIRPVDSNRLPNVPLAAQIYREPNLEMPQSLQLSTQDLIGPTSELVSGAFQALSGGDMGSNDTGMGIMMQRDQALGRLGLAWRNIKEAQAETMQQAVECLANNRNHEGTVQIPGKTPMLVELSDLKGNFRCFPQTEENFPESFTQKQNRLALLVTDAIQSPMLQQLLDDPDNVELIKNGIGLEELQSPVLEARDKQLGEIEILLRSGPAPNPAAMQAKLQIAQLAQAAQLNPQLAPQVQQATQQAQQIPPNVSTVEVDPECDNHAVEMATCLRFINSPNGRALKNGDEKQRGGFMNVRVHFLEHQAALKQQQAQNQPPPLVKPVSISLNAKDAPPPAAAEIYKKAGIPANPQDFVVQDATEAAEKHPTQVVGAVQ